jgi:hypothetical protein
MTHAEKIRTQSIKYLKRVFPNGIPQWMVGKINDVYERTKDSGGELKESVF